MCWTTSWSSRRWKSVTEGSGSNGSKRLRLEAFEELGGGTDRASVGDAGDSIRKDYAAYVDSFQFYKNPSIQAWVEQKRNEGRVLYREPFLTLAKPFLGGSSLQSLIDEGVLHPDTRQVFAKTAGRPDGGRRGAVR